MALFNHIFIVISSTNEKSFLRRSHFGFISVVKGLKLPANWIDSYLNAFSGITTVKNAQPRISVPKPLLRIMSPMGGAMAPLVVDLSNRQSFTTIRRASILKETFPLFGAQSLRVTLGRGLRVFRNSAVEFILTGKKISWNWKNEIFQHLSMKYIKNLATWNSDCLFCKSLSLRF